MKAYPTKRLARIALAAFLLSCVPLILLAFFNHPANDDFVFGAVTSRVWRETGSLPQLICAALGETARVYREWQGSFSAVFLFTLQPAIFGEGWYAVCTFLLLGSFLLSSLLLARALLVDWLGCPTSAVWLTALPLLLCSIQWMPSPTQSIYWYNGSVYYTFFYALSLLLFYLVAQGALRGAGARGGKLAAACLLGLVVGGGNYVTALLTTLILGLLAALGLSKRRRALLLPAGLPLLFVSLSFALSAASPGNAVRAACYPWHQPDAVRAVLQSFEYACAHLLEWTTPAALLCLLLAAPFLARAAGRTAFEFRWPGAVSILSFCLFAAQFAPPCYAMGSEGEQRITNIIYFSLFWLYAINLFYWGGWLARRLEGRGKDASALLDRTLSRCRRHAAAFALLGLCCLALPQNGTPASASAAFSLLSGQASQYQEEHEKRLSLLTDPAVPNPELPPYTSVPPLLLYGGLTDDPDYEWSNRPMAEYYQKESVRLKKTD